MASIEEKRKKAFGDSYTPVESKIPAGDHKRMKMALERMVRAKRSQDDLLDFCQFTSPDIKNPSDSSLTRYIVKRHHQALGASLQAMSEGALTRLIVSMPPRHGKTELCCVRFIPWFLGKFPGESVIYATYGADLSGDKGVEVREVMQSKAYAQVFPSAKLTAGGKSREKLRTTSGGEAFFVGKGGAITGRGGDLIVVDDLFKNNEEADSPAARDKAWNWFTGTLYNRLMSDSGSIVMVMTRWHEDDIIGRLTDPSSDYYSEEVAERWTVINLAGLAGDNDVLGRKPGEALWPEKFGEDFLLEQKRMDSRKFACLYQGDPAPEDGIFFTRDMFCYYDPSQIDMSLLRIYASSDLSVGTKTQRRDGRVSDRTVHMIWGVDKNDNAYLLDAMINRDDPFKNVELMITMMKQHKPITWFTYEDHITGSIRPFLLKRMSERRAFCHIKEMTSRGTKEQKAQPFKARMSMHKIYFPKARFWARDIVDELIKFPAGQHDDCVDTCALFGQGLDTQLSGKTPEDISANIPEFGTLAWVKWSEEKEEAIKMATEYSDGF